MNDAKMVVHNLEPGSPEWLEHRNTNTYNASDAPAMLGCSPHKSRTDLLDELHKGFSADVSAFQDRIRAGGHRREALARPLVESTILQEDLYPIVASRAWPKLSRALGASFDGLTIGRDRGWEHKQLNDDLRAALPIMDADALAADTDVAQRLPKHYRVQMEQQLMVCPSLEGVLFSASDWDDAGNLIEARHCWYYSSPELRAEIAAGWQQLEADLAGHVPKVHTERPQGEVMEALPVLVVQVEGRIVSSNLQVWREAALKHIAGINKDLKTDEDFADAKEAVKWCDESAKKIKLLKEQTLAQMVDVNELVKTLDTIVGGLDRTRIDLGNLVTSRETAIRNEVARRGEQELFAHLANLNVRIGKAYMPVATHALIAADFQKAIKSKRTIKSLNDSVDAELARCKIAASALADRIQTNLKLLAESCADYLTLFADERTLVLKDCDDFKAVALGRVNEAKAAEERRLEADRERIRKEEADRLQHEQEARDRAAEAAKPAPTPAPSPIAAPAPVSQGSAGDIGEQLAALPVLGKLSSVGGRGSGRFTFEPNPNVVPLGTRAPAAASSAAPATSDEWQPAETLPTAPDHWIAVQEVVLYRWLPYKPASSEARRGIKGRWQRHNGYGFENSEPPAGPWRIGEEVSEAA